MVTFHATMTFVNGYKVQLFLSVLRKDFKLKELDTWRRTQTAPVPVAQSL